MIYEEKITQTDDDDKGEINENSRVYEEEIKQLKEVIETIKDDIESIKRQISRRSLKNKSFLIKQNVQFLRKILELSKWKQKMKELMY